jgi:hypothetical protein
MSEELRPDRCPLCAEPNDCGLAAGKTDCWCFAVKISPDALALLPEKARGKMCVCRKCAAAESSSTAMAADPQRPKASR